MTSLLLLGSTGFLGRSVFRELLPLTKLEHELLISQNTAAEAMIRLTRFGPDSIKTEAFDLDEANGLPYSNVVVVNCASSRRSQDETISKLGNYDFPKRILEALSRNQNSRIHWVQFETFWQYSKSGLPDPTYVFWKNQFGSELEAFSLKPQITYQKVVLPHLIGPDDGLNRFLPRIFLKLLKGEDVVLNSPNEKFHLTDARDVAKWLVSTIRNHEWQTINSSVLFPSHELTLQEIVNRFALHTNSNSMITSIHDDKYSNPLLIKEDQPPVASLELMSLRTIDITFADIAQWLSEVAHIDSL